jgi:tetratricopeptide (TPR) repeat protein
LHVDPEAVAKLPSWQYYAERLGRSLYSDYVAATHMQKLFTASFMRAQNDAAFQRVEAKCRELLAGMSALDRKAVERWWDPALHGASDRPLEFVVGAYRMKAGDYPAAARLIRIARRGVPAISSWRLELTWLLLQCHRELHTEPTLEDHQLCQEAIGLGELLNQYSQPGDARVLRYLGLAYNLAGNHSAAISTLEPIAASSAGAEGWEVVAALADSYVRVGNADAARRVLDAASRDPEVGKAALSLLREIDSGATPGRSAR